MGSFSLTGMGLMTCLNASVNAVVYVVFNAPQLKYIIAFFFFYLTHFGGQGRNPFKFFSLFLGNGVLRKITFEI